MYRYLFNVSEGQWCVELRRADNYPALYLAFGHTAVATVHAAPEQVPSLDYLRIFVTDLAAGTRPPARVIQSDVTLAEVLAGLAPDDLRLRDAVLAAITTD